MSPTELEDKISQCWHDSQRWFPGFNNSLPHLALCLAGEVGELANEIKKVVRGSANISDPAVAEKMALEVVDIWVYLCNIMGHDAFDDFNWEELWNKKRTFNEARFGPKAPTEEQFRRESQGNWPTDTDAETLDSGGTPAAENKTTPTLSVGSNLYPKDSTSPIAGTLGKFAS